MRRAIVLILVSSLGCTQKLARKPPALPSACGPAEPLPKPICTKGSEWKPGMQAFVDKTHAWGLDTLHVEGQRLAVVDFDGDGWPDLVVRQVGGPSSDLAPGGVRREWLLRNTGHGTFEDVTVSSGILQARTQPATVGRPGEVWAFGDVNNDGHEDVYTGLDTEDATKSLGETSEIMLNNGDGTFRLGPKVSDVRRTKDVDVPGGASFVDYDHDGNLDLWVPQYNTAAGQFLQSHLYRGDGGGGFKEVTDQVGLTTNDWSDLAKVNAGEGDARAWSATACDLNDDGYDELLTASYGRAPNLLFQAVPHPDGTVTYENRSVASGYAYDDNFSYKDNQFFLCWCTTNHSSPDCEGVAAPEIQCPSPPQWDPTYDTQKFRLGGNSATTLCVDLNNDGHLDLVTSEIKHWWAGEGSDEAEVLVNTGDKDVTFTRPGRASMGLVVPHWSLSWDEGIMTSAAFDFDNDGWDDLYFGMSDYPGNHGLLFHQKAPLQFEPVPIDEGIDQHRSHGIAVADFDRDGDLDVVVGTSLARCDQNAPDNCYPTAQVRFFENVIGQDGNWIELLLQGTKGTNYDAIGARVTVTAGGITQTQEVEGGHGHFGMEDDHTLHFGLGTACEADVTVRWPDAALTTQKVHLVSGHRYKLIQGCGPTVADLKEST